MRSDSEVAVAAIHLPGFHRSAALNSLMGFYGVSEGEPTRIRDIDRGVAARVCALSHGAVPSARTPAGVVPAALQLSPSSSQRSGPSGLSPSSSQRSGPSELEPLEHLQAQREVRRERPQRGVVAALRSRAASSRAPRTRPSCAEHSAHTNASPARRRCSCSRRWGSGGGCAFLGGLGRGSCERLCHGAPEPLHAARHAAARVQAAAERRGKRSRRARGRPRGSERVLCRLHRAGERPQRGGSRQHEAAQSLERRRRRAAGGPPARPAAASAFFLPAPPAALKRAGVFRRTYLLTDTQASKRNRPTASPPGVMHG